MKTVNVVAAIICHEGKIFCTQRGYGDFKDGWEFPGGKVEPGETPEQAIVREIQEELGAEIAVDSFYEQVEYDYPTFHLSMGCYLCHVVSGHLTLLEHEAATWLAPSELGTLDWLPADAGVVERLQRSEIK